MLPTPRGCVFIGLNVVRALSIISLVLVFASSIVTMVHDVEAVNTFNADGHTNSTIAKDWVDHDYYPGSTVPNQPAGVFWAVLNRLLIISQVVVLILSEVGWPDKFFTSFFPVLGKDFGLGALGVIQGLIGAAILSHHVDTFALVSSWFLISIGLLNILLGLIFREKVKPRRSIFAWRERARDVLPTVNVGGRRFDVVDTADKFSGFVSDMKEKRMEHQNTGLSNSSTAVGSEGPDGYGKAGRGFGRHGELLATREGLMVTRPLKLAQNYSPRPVTMAAPSVESGTTVA